MTTAWESLDDPRALSAALGRIVDLSQLLERERHAVSALDPAGLARLAEQKVKLLDGLRDLIALPGSPSRPRPRQHQALRDEVRVAALRLSALAEANLALLSDAIRTMSSALGIEQETGTYDARARITRRIRPFAGKRA